MLHWIDCDIFYLCSRGSSSCCIWLIVILFICVLMVLPQVALDWLWHCLSVFSLVFLMLHWIDCDIFLYVILWFFLMLHWIDCDIVCLCSCGSSSCCTGFIVTLFVFILMVLPHVALDWLILLFFCSFSSTSCCIELIVVLFICVHGSSSCCIGLTVTLLAFVLMVQPYVALDRLWHCLSVFSWFFLMLHWIDCDIVYLCYHGSSSCCIVLIVTVFICVLMVLPHVALDWLWLCLSLFLWFFLQLHLIDSDIVCLCSYGSSSCCIGLIVTLFFFVLMVLPHFALDWLWYCLFVFSWFFLKLHWIDCGIIYLCSQWSS